jgi:F-type H+-transporting ATPase subunit b
MPHLDFGTYAGQLFWLAICFVSLYFIVARSVLPKIGGVLEVRGNKIASDLEGADKANNEAGTIETKYQKSLAETSERARNLIEESSKKAKEKLEAKRLDLASKLDEKIKKAEAQVAKIETESQAAVADITAQLAREISAKIAA